MTDSETVDTPMESKLNITKVQHVYNKALDQQLIGRLIYFSVLIRPDVTL